MLSRPLSLVLLGLAAVAAMIFIFGRDRPITVYEAHDDEPNRDWCAGAPPPMYLRGALPIEPWLQENGTRIVPTETDGDDRPLMPMRTQARFIANGFYRWKGHAAAWRWRVFEDYPAAGCGRPPWEKTWRYALNGAHPDAIPVDPKNPPAALFVRIECIGPQGEKRFVASTNDGGNINALAASRLAPWAPPPADARTTP